jgi:PAS domain S-box-containing protein
MTVASAVVTYTGDSLSIISEISIMSIPASDDCNNANLPSLSADRVQFDRAVDAIQIQTDFDRQIQASQVTEVILQQQIQRQRLMMEIGQRIRQSLTITDILQTTVDEVRQFLQTDRVLLFEFAADFSGTVACESVGTEWMSLLSHQINDPCIARDYLEPFRQGQITVKSDIYAEEIDPCHIELLARYQVRANLVVPILQGEELWGLLVAHHCTAPRQWQLLDIDLLRQLAVQLGIAMQQANLLAQARSELTDRRQAEVELEDLYNHAPCGYHSLDRDGKYIRINDTELAMLGYTRAEILGKAFSDLLTPASLEIFQRNFPMFQQQGWIEDLEFEMIRQDGTILTVSLNSRVVYDRDGNYLMSRSVVMDISERVRIRAERERFLTIGSDLQIIVGDNGYFQWISPSLEQTLGWTMAEMTSCPWTEFVHPEDIETSVAEAASLFAGRDTVAFEHRLRRKDGTYRSLLWKAQAYPEEQRIYAAALDITEKKHLEQQFLRAQRLESLGTLASGIAHDMNNILTPILSASQLLPLRLPDVEDRTRSLFRIVEESARRGSELVKQILSFARGSDGTRTSVQLRHILAEVVRVARQTFPRSIDISLNLETTELWSISADPTQLHQVLMNLTINARDAMPEGGTLSIAAGNIMLDKIYARMNIDANIGAYVVVTIADTGIGIPPELLERIFEPFFTTKAPGQGTGLGLSTTLGIIKSHGGFVSVYSDKGQGTRFNVYLPAEPSAQIVQPVDSAELPFGHGELVLVVDDEVSVREITKATLEAYNYRSITASDGIEAIALYAQLQAEIQFILLDLMMPSLDSASTIRALQRIDPNVAIVVMSGLSANQPIKNINDLNVQAFLAKPFTSEQLLQTLAQLRIT